MGRKLQFFLFYEKRSKSTATARSESTAKHENKDNTDYIVTNLIDFLAMIAKRSKRRLNKEIFVCKKYCTD